MGDGGGGERSASYSDVLICLSLFFFKDRLDILFKERKEKRQRAVEEDMSIPAIIRKKPRTEITSSPAMATRASREQKHVHFVLNNISPRSLSKDKCPCGKLKGGTWIQCDKCDQWMHVDCVDMAEPIEMDDAFFCPLCRSENPPDPRAVKIMIEPSINLEKRDLGHRVDKGAVGKRGVGRREAVAAAERVEEAGEGRSVGMEKDKVKEEEETTPKAEVFLPNVFVMGRRWHPNEGGDSKAEETCTSHVGTAGTGKDKNDGEVTVKKGDVERKKVDE